MECLLNLNYDWRHNKIIHKSPQELYQLPLIKSTLDLYYEEPDEIWKTDELIGNVRNRIALLEVPNTVKDDMVLIAKFILDQMGEFNKILHGCLVFTTIDWSILKSRTQWTSQGTIDKQRTGETLVDDFALDVTIRFRMAVMFYLEDRINALSIQLPPDYCHKDQNIFMKMIDIDNISIAKKHFDIPEREINNLFCFEMMVQDGNECDQFYYWHRLTEEEKNIVQDLTFIENNHPFVSSKTMFFIFTNCDSLEKKLELLQNEYCLSLLLRELLQFHCLPIFSACISDGLTRLTTDPVSALLYDSSLTVSTGTYKKQYVLICALLLQHLSKDSSITNLNDAYSGNRIMRALHNLTKEKEIGPVRTFLESVDNAWLKKQFTSSSHPLKWLIIASFECGMIEFVFNCAFETTEKRVEFCSNPVIYYVTEYFILMDQLDNIDAIISLLFNFEDVKSYKMKFANKHGFNVCFELFMEGKWEIVENFVRWCFVSEEEIDAFYNKFFSMFVR